MIEQLKNYLTFSCIDKLISKHIYVHTLLFFGSIDFSIFLSTICVHCLIIIVIIIIQFQSLIHFHLNFTFDQHHYPNLDPAEYLEQYIRRFLLWGVEFCI